MKNSILSATFLLICATFGAAQHTSYRGKEAAALCAGSTALHYAAISKVPVFVQFGEHSNIPFATVQQQLTRILGIKSDEKLVLYRTETDKLGFNNYRYQQYYKGIKVENGQYLVHEKNGMVRSMNGLWLDNIHLNTNPALTEAQALQAALNHTNASLYKWEVPSEEAFVKTHLNNPEATYYPKGSLAIVAPNFDYTTGKFHFCYKFDVYAAEPVSRNWVYVDAQTGEIVATENRIHGVDVPSTATTYYSGTKAITTDMVSAGNYRLRESGRGLGIETYNMLNGTNYGAAVDFTNTTSTWNTVADKQAYDVHWGMESAYDYYLNVHGRNSLDNAGVKLKMYTHYSSNLADAGHIPDQPIFYFGDGNLGSGFKPFTSLDICAHEFTHGVTSYSCQLLYAAESSALHESFSDMFAMAVDFYTRPATANWQMADEVYVAAGNCIRNIANPNSKSHPDTYHGTYWYSGNNLNLVSHTNSAVSSYWFYLMCQGGSGTNDIGSVYNVTGIGLTKGEQIAYRTLTVYMTSFAQFADARMYSIQAAEDLYGVCSPEVATVTNAWYAVGVGAAYSATPHATFAASGTYSCSAPFTVNFANYSNNTSTASWNFGDNSTSSSAATTVSHTYTSPGVYNVKLIAGGTCGVDSLLLNSYITVSTPAAPTATNSSSCTASTFNLSASGNGTLNWYSASVGGASLHTGSSFTTPFLNTTTTYYVEDKIAGTTGSVGPSTWAGLFGGYQAEFATFDVLQACTLRSVTTQSYVAGTRNLTLRNKVGTVLLDTLLNLPTGVVTINLNIALAPGIGYELGGDTLNFAFDPTNTAYPYTLPGVASITGNTLGSYYLFFYNWQFETAACVSTRTPVTASVLSQNTASITYPSASICRSAAVVNPTLTGTGGAGTYTAPAGLSINASTGQVTPSTSTAGTYSIQYTSTGACPNTSTFSMTIVNNDAATISYPSASYCTNATNPTPTRLGTSGGSYSAPAGLSINSSTGLINLAGSSAGTYTVQYQTANACPTTTSTSVTIQNVNTATISYPSASYCTNATNPIPTRLGTSGGSYSAPVGLSINSSTGLIDLASSSAGTYTVQYQTANACPTTTNTSVTIQNVNDATFSYTSSTFCQAQTNPSPTATNGGGTFSSSPAGLSINTGTGLIDLTSSAVGSYEVIYTTTGACPDTDTISLVVTAVGDATFHYDAASFCINRGTTNATITGISGGTFSTSAGLNLNTSTGVIDLNSSTAGIYTVQYNVSGICPAASNVTVTINSLDNASFSYSAGAYCTNMEANAIATITGLAGGSFSSNPSGVVFVNANTGEINFPAMATLSGTYQIVYTTNGQCPNTSSFNVELNICGGISNTLNNNSIQVFPNPNHGQFEVRFLGTAGELWLEVVNSLGQTFYKQQQIVQAQDSYQVDLGDIPSGVYWLRFQQQHQQYTTKIVIAK